jgi:endonuclease-3
MCIGFFYGFYQMAILSKKKIIEIFTRWRDQNPNPTTELNYTNPYTLLVAVVCSAQMTDTGVNRATAALFEIVKTPYDMVALGTEKLREHLQTINYNNTKTKNVIALSQALIDQFNGEVPADHAALVSLPGVGNKTANVVLNTAFGQNTMAVDTHILRVSNRVGLAEGDTPEAIEKQLLKNIPEEFLYNAHHWILLHGRYVCKARKPDCPTCMIRDVCQFGDKTKIESLGKLI